MKKRFLNVYSKRLAIGVALTSMMACGSSYKTPSAAEVTGANLTDSAGTGSQISSIPSSGTSHQVVLNQVMTVRSEMGGVLERQADLPVGTEIEVPNDFSSKNLDYRDASGNLVRSSTGFIFPIKVISVPSAYQSLFPPSKLNTINNINGGLFIFASIVGVLQGVDGQFTALVPGTPGAGFLKNYTLSGRPTFSYTKSATNRFGGRLNQGVDARSMSAADVQKWQGIYSELRKAADRSTATAKSYLMVNAVTANKASLDYESTGAVATNGAWSIAVGQTAVRHGFANVPCAEFQSELVREAYQRAGYRVTEDFNSSKGNTLIWSQTAAVVNFSMALYKAGWIPWDATKYRPKTGAILMNGSGESPGHTYSAASDDGTFIIDNGAPQGRDLRITSQSIIEMMYQTGVFFLPPGINPDLWP